VGRAPGPRFFKQGRYHSFRIHFFYVPTYPISIDTRPGIDVRTLFCSRTHVTYKY
jgi:hypothetical protein